MKYLLLCLSLLSTTASADISKHMSHISNELYQSIRNVIDCGVIGGWNEDLTASPKELEKYTETFLNAALDMHNTERQHVAKGKIAVLRVFRDRAAWAYLSKEKFSEQQIKTEIAKCDDFFQWVLEQNEK
jgi:hypothetical protein